MKGIATDKTIDGQYDVTTHKAIIPVLRPLMVVYGLIDWMNAIDSQISDTGVTRGNANRALMQTRGYYTYTVANIDKMEEQINFNVYGYGDDAGDKAPGKASTYALKTAQKIIFQIGTDDDEEGRGGDDTHASKVGLTPQQLEELLFQADEYFGDDAPDKLMAMCSQIFHVEATAQIPNTMFQPAMKLLKNQAIRDGKIDGELKKDDV